MARRAITQEYDTVGRGFILAMIIFQNTIAAIGKRYDWRIRIRYMCIALSNTHNPSAEN